MKSKRSLPTKRDTRAATRQWFHNWKRVGPLLEAERWDRLRRMTDSERARMTLDLLSLWRPDRPGDDGEALVRVQRAFAVWRRRLKPSTRGLAKARRSLPR